MKARIKAGLAVFLVGMFAGSSAVWAQSDGVSFEGGPCTTHAYETTGCSQTPGSSHTSTIGATHAGDDHSSACYACVQGETPVAWYSCHSSNCTVPLEPDVREALVEIVDAAGRGDAGGIVRLARGAARFVTVNMARRSVQVLSCSGNVIASLPVADAALLAEYRATVEFAMLLSRMSEALPGFAGTVLPAS